MLNTLISHLHFFINLLFLQIFRVKSLFHLAVTIGTVYYIITNYKIKDNSGISPQSQSVIFRHLSLTILFFFKADWKVFFQILYILRDYNEYLGNRPQMNAV